MCERRRFLKVLGATAMASACAVDDGTPSEFGTGSATSGSGAGGDPGTTDASGSGGAGGAGALPANFAVVAQLANLKQGVLTAVPGKGLLLGRDAGGVYAMSSLCTHQQCDMTVKGAAIANGIRCTCHNSRFDLNGAVTVGPASKPLQHYKAAVGPKGEVGVDLKQPVAATDRAVVA